MTNPWNKNIVCGKCGELFMCRNKKAEHCISVNMCVCKECCELVMGKGGNDIYGCIFKRTKEEVHFT